MTMNNHALAVLISTYAKDDAYRLDQALKSVYDQVLPKDYEIRVYLGIDGNISDLHEEVINKYSNDLYCIFRSAHNVGLCIMLNNLINSLTDEFYVFRMDADDISFPFRFSEQIAFLIAHPDVDIVGTNIIEFDSLSGRRRMVTFPQTHIEAISKICYRVPVAHPTVCFRRSVFTSVHKYPIVNGNEDIAMWFDCAFAGLKFGNVQQPLLEFYINPSFWKRRGVSKSLSEFSCYVNGIWRINGFTWKFIFPLARLIFRFCPTLIIKLIYASPLRVRASVKEN